MEEINGINRKYNQTTEIYSSTKDNITINKCQKQKE
jgi:hypothetical protein